MTNRDPAVNELIGICDVSGKTTLQLKDFTQIPFGDNYCTSLKKIGDSILFIQSRGNLSHHNADHFYSKLDAFCKAANIEPPYVQIRDFTYLQGRTSLVDLKKQLRWIYKQKNEMIGLVMINRPSWISSFVAKWLRFFGNEVQVVTVKSYEEAIHAAERLLTERESNPVTASKGLRFSDLIFKPEWEYHAEKSVLYRIGCIPGKLLYTAIHGSPTKTETVTEACILLEKVMKENQLINIPYMIADYSEAGETSIHIRQTYAKEIRRITIDTENSNVTQFIAGANTFNKIAIRIFSTFIRRKIIFVPTVEEAFQKIADFSSFDLDSSDSITVRKSDLDEISHFFGTMLLNQDYYPDQKKVSKENPLSYLAESLELIKLDHEELKVKEKRIEQQRLAESEAARLALAESERKYALLAESATELLNFTSTEQVYEYTASKLYEVLQEQAIVAIVQYDQGCKHWNMKAIKGLDEKSISASKLMGFDIDKSEGDILPEYNDALVDGKLVEMDIDFGKFYSNTVPQVIENGLKKLFSIEKMYCIALQENQQIYGNITLIPRDGLQINREVIEAFTAQASAFLNRIKATEALNEARELAEEASAAKNEFLAVVSHELRTPLNGVIGFTELLLNGKLTPEQQQYVKLANISGHKLLKIIEDILNLTSIESDAFELENEKTAIAELIQQSYEIFKPSADKKGLQLRLVLEGDLPKYVMTDNGKFSQILFNLLSNAVKFTEQGEVILKISSQPLEHGYHLFSISVEDTGIGIDSDLQEILFLPFTQADMSSRRKYGGTGLGLAICQQIAEKMGTSIAVESELGKGSRFFFNVELKSTDRREKQQLEIDANSVADPEAEADLKKNRNLSILVAEDEKLNLILIRSLLETMLIDVEIRTAANGEEAVHLYHEQKPDLILMDIQMPLMDGLKATEGIRRFEKENGAAKRIPIIALTAGAMKQDRDQCLAAGMDEVLTKPVSRQELSSAFLEWLPGIKMKAPKKK